jgi:hypothetical protein
MQKVAIVHFLKSIATIATLSVGFVLTPIDRGSISATEGLQNIGLMFYDIVMIMIMIMIIRLKSSSYSSPATQL